MQWSYFPPGKGRPLDRQQNNLDNQFQLIIYTVLGHCVNDQLKSYKSHFKSKNVFNFFLAGKINMKLII